MEPWVTLVLTGAAIAGYGWLIPKSNTKGSDGSEASANEEAYDRLLEDLETENRELVDAVAKFKNEQDETVRRLGRRIRELETQMAQWKEQTREAAPAARFAPVSPAGTADGAIAEGTAASSAIAVENGHGAAPSTAPASAAPAAGNAAPAAEAIPAAGGPDAPEAAEAHTSIRGRYAELLDLHERGRSVEQIAKTLGLNKGEVQLILQLARREVEPRA
ncbi:hypothetical protein H7B90_05420 [Cohnella xylanilytica]|uniref:Uncharacterized protein n=1 Tax=Cohnella xylanilytica TaxID=557555 RepID=A0A841TT26_9BACL|nr:hypothetical protein [Cohnella xylanilytica]MBB6690839.1 hypothetical protein [Cohnella xylanilytica]